MDSSDFWGAIAQIIPVVGLALVIEARVMARQLSRKTVYERTRFIRVVSGILFVALAAALISVEIEALEALRTGETSAQAELTAAVIVTLALAYVAAGPVYSVGMALMGDVFALLPWSLRSRELRAKTATADRLAAAERSWRAQRLEVWGNLATLQIQFVRGAAQADRYPHTVSAEDKAFIPLIEKEMASTMEKIRHLRATSEQHVGDAVAAAEQMRRAGLDIDSLRRALSGLAK